MLKNLFGKNLILRKYQTLIEQINALENHFQTLSDSELRVKTLDLRKKYNHKQDLNVLIAESFAVTREASLRTLGLRHFDVQLLGGLVLNSGKIAEMKTGEGKTLVATLPSYLNALTNSGVHIVTVNDYLANRDQISMGQIYRFLGLNTGLIQEDMMTFERKQNYNADITYVTNNELGFDYLRDNLALNIKNVVLRPFNFCIIDEVDSVLIDEAQTPLIISERINTCIDKYILAAEISNYLEVNLHFKIDEKNKNVSLTEQGTIKIEQILNIQNLYNPSDPWIPFILNAIKANTLFFLNVHYIIQNNQIVIVDEFTGRIMPDRRWSEGLHQAVEAKEKLPIRQNSETIASITYQNFFLLYPKLSGMTGTAKTAEIEFEKIYDLSVKEIPTALPNRRKDLSDLIYKDQFSKWKAIAKKCYDLSKTEQPILIGTTTVEKSEMLAQLLNEYNLLYQILNAKPKNVRRESEIIAQAGKKKSITIATNMAGRGTDIILGGNIKYIIRKTLYEIFINYKKERISYNLSEKIELMIERLNLSRIFSQKFIILLKFLTNNKNFFSKSDIEILRTLTESEQIRTPKTLNEYYIKTITNEILRYQNKQQKQESIIVKNLGGLYIIGTERHESKRIDNQLRGRAGRQGDPGISRFFLSIDDNLLRIFGGSNIQTIMQNQFFDDLPIESKLLTKSLDAAQNQVEERAYEQRKNLFDYDDVLNKQRNVIYHERRKLLEKESVTNELLAYGEQLLSEILIELKRKNIDSNKMRLVIENLFGNSVSKNFWKQFFDDEGKFLYNESFKFKEYLFQELWLSYQIKGLEFEVHEFNIVKALERNLILINIDTIWKEHLQNMTLLRDAVGWRGYGQRNPLYEYKEEAYQLFQNQTSIIRQLIIYDHIRSSII